MSWQQRDGGHRLVARADRRRAGVVLGLPAPRQSVAGRARRRRDLAGRSQHHGGDDELDADDILDDVRRAGRPAARSPTAGASPAISATRPGWWWSTRERPACSTRAPLDARRRRAGLARRADARRRRPPAGRHVPAVPAAPGPPLRRGVQRGARRRRAGVGAARKAGETLRQACDLEHWAAFQDGFQTVRGWRSRSPAASAAAHRGTITFLSGDVHHSYVSEVDPTRRSDRTAAEPAGSSRRCARRSATRCRGRMRFLVARAGLRHRGPIGHVVAARRPRCPTRRSTWKPAQGPVVRQQPGHPRGHRLGPRIWWAPGKVEDGVHDRPRLARVSEVTVD